MAGILAGLLGAVKGLGGNLLGSAMNFLSNNGDSIIGGLFSKAGQYSQYKYQKNLQDDAQGHDLLMQENQFNFNAREAELARQWQEDFYNQYQSPAAMMAQYQAAGINPSLVAGQGAGSPPSASSANGSSGSSGIGSVASTNLVSDIAQMMLIKAQLKEIESRENLNNSQAGLFQAETTKTGIDIEFSPQIYRMNLETGKVNIQNTLAGIRQIESNIDLSVKEFNQNKKESDSRISLNDAERGLKLMEKLLVEAQTKESESRYSLNLSTIGFNDANTAYIKEKTLQEYWETRYREEYNTIPSSSLYTFIQERLKRARGAQTRIGADDKFLRE